jgi:two-component system cell cycle response regulator
MTNGGIISPPASSRKAIDQTSDLYKMDYEDKIGPRIMESKKISINKMEVDSINMNVLIAEDDLISCRTLEKNLQDWGYRVHVTKNGQEAWEIIKNGGIRLAILDWGMPKMDGLELCHKIRNEYQPKEEKYLYIILLTGRDLEEDIITGLSAGADDYMTKPFSYMELKVRIQNGERIIALQDIVLQKANTDSLTQLWNRKKILELLEEELNRNFRDNKPVGVIMLDIDNFKSINDTYGHLIGDKVIIEVASRLKNNVRSYDKIGRYGGDELLLVLPGLGRKDAKNIAERLRESVCAEKIQTEAGALNTTISLGVSVFDNASSPSTKKIIEESDLALYIAKAQGRNIAVVSEPDMVAEKEIK